MSYPTDLKYTKDHEWIRFDSGTGVVGITDFAQQQLGDVVYVELPEVGAQLDFSAEDGRAASATLTQNGQTLVLQRK